MYYTKSRIYESSEVDKNSVVDISSVKLIDKNSLLVENTCLKLKELHKKAVVYQSVFSPSMEYRDKSSVLYIPKVSFTKDLRWTKIQL